MRSIRTLLCLLFLVPSLSLAGQQFEVSLAEGITLGSATPELGSTVTIIVDFTKDPLQFGAFCSTKMFATSDIYFGLGLHWILSGGPSTGLGLGAGFAVGYLNELSSSYVSGFGGIARVTIDYRFGTPGITIGSVFEWMAFILPEIGVRPRNPLTISISFGYLF